MADDGLHRQQPPTLKVASAGNLILLQLFSRFLTLFMTQMQIRLTSPEVLGAANIHFELLLGLILTLSREGFRTALSRSSGSAASNSIQNVALLPIPIGIGISTVIMTLYASYLAPLTLQAHPDFAWANFSFVAGAVLELIAEPLYIRALIEVDTMTRVRAEGMAITAKSASTLISLWLMEDSSSLLPFGIGQLAFGATFLAIFWLAHTAREGLATSIRYLTFTRDGEGSDNANAVLFDRASLKLSWTMTKQNLVKHAIGEGDKIAVAQLTSLSDQGAYAVASNYGSLVARILYQPLEESSRLTFARALGDEQAINSRNEEAAASLLSSLLSFYFLLASFLMVFCAPYSSPVLLLVAGRKWALTTSAPSILATYGSFYLPAMAFNGLLEGFLQATASNSELTRYAYVLVEASVLFVFNLLVQYHFQLITPEKGLILATSMSTMMRALYCYHYTSDFFISKASLRKSQSGSPLTAASRKDLTWRTFLPHPLTLATFFLSAGITRWQPIFTQATSEGLDPKHLLTGFTCACMCASACILFERRTLLGTLAVVRGKVQ